MFKNDHDQMMCLDKINADVSKFKIKNNQYLKKLVQNTHITMNEMKSMKNLFKDVSSLALFQ